MCSQAASSKNKVVLVKDALSKLSKQQYSIEELTRKPLPEGVDPLRLEDYLSDEDFKVPRPRCDLYPDAALGIQLKHLKTLFCLVPFYRHFLRWVELSSTPCQTGNSRIWRRTRVCFKKNKHHITHSFVLLPFCSFFLKLFLIPIL